MFAISSSLVSIGLPTHNGERYVAEALESLLAQDHPFLEVVVSDNASTDRTPDIVRDFVRRDRRIRYERLEQPITAAQNFNRAFALSTGSQFMWAADDDLWEPSYIRRCVEGLAERPDAVMASTGLRFIDPEGTTIDTDYSRYDNPDLGSASVVDRVRLLLRRGGWYQVYGLARRAALERTHLFQDIYGPDVVLVLELAMLGPIVRIPETLFWYRRQPGRTEEARAERQGGIADEARVLRTKSTHLEEELSDAVRRAPISGPLKLRLQAEILRAAYVDDTPMSSRTRSETWVRAKAAARERDVRRFVKFGLASGLANLRRLEIAGRRTIGRLLR